MNGKLDCQLVIQMIGRTWDRQIATYASQLDCPLKVAGGYICKSSVCPRGGNPVLGIVADPEEDVPGTGLTAETQHPMLYSNIFFLDS